MSKEIIQSVPFDPGFSRYFPLINEDIFIHLEAINRLKTPNQRKFQLQKIERSLTKQLTSMMCIYYGCVTYGSIIASKYTNPPAKITGNPVFEVPEKHQTEIDLTIESRHIAEIYKLFSRSIEFNFKRKCKIPSNFLETIQTYNEFMQLNNHFIHINSTEQLKLPEKFSHFKGYTKERLDELESTVFNLVNTGQLDKLLNIS